MRVSGTGRLEIAPHLAYGDRGARSLIRETLPFSPLRCHAHILEQ